ncbi:type I-E CRISPR-associated protein Cas6/Cse3/CasE [Streptomyces sp. NPDC090741]|uniref:type I-E CRISPR-associated protein Cas6/Cse3/CasE n=1 Tax=Streptomyces sp. NPDC090741 TaxID=3365967 RepID=UPI00382268CE
MTATTSTRLALARIPLNPASRDVHRDVRDPGQMHRTVMNLIDREDGNPTARSDANLLHRLDLGPDGASLLVQATVPIHLDRLPDGYAQSAPAQRDATPVLDWIAAGRTVRYRIHANPVTTTRDPQLLHQEADRRAESAVKAGQTFAAAARLREEFLARAARQAAKRRGITLPVTSDTIAAWWTRTAETHGLHIDLVIDSPLPRITARRSDAPTVTLTAVALDGIATITNSDAVCTAVTNGIGKGRAYGLGLLSLAPHKE